MQPHTQLPQAPQIQTTPVLAKPSRSTLISRNVTVSGHRTSVRLEPEMWNGFTEICRRERATLHEVCTAVAQHKAANTSLTAAIRVFVMAYFRAASTEDGHTRAGHGQGLVVGAAVAQIVNKIFAQTAARPAATTSSTPPPLRNNPLMRDDMAVNDPMAGVSYKSEPSPSFNPSMLTRR